MGAVCVYIRHSYSTYAYILSIIISVTYFIIYFYIYTPLYTLSLYIHVYCRYRVSMTTGVGDDRWNKFPSSVSSDLDPVTTRTYLDEYTATQLPLDADYEGKEYNIYLVLFITYYLIIFVCIHYFCLLCLFPRPFTPPFYPYLTPYFLCIIVNR